MTTESNDFKSGPVWAAIVSAATGCAALGVLTLLTEVSPSISKLLTFVKSSGDLSGATTVGLIIWIASWVALHRLWKSRSVRGVTRLAAGALLLIAIGLAGTFPPVADWFSGK